MLKMGGARDGPNDCQGFNMPRPLASPARFV